MNISLTPQQERLIQEKLKSGKYSTVDRVIDEALQLLEERDRQDENWSAEDEVDLLKQLSTLMMTSGR